MCIKFTADVTFRYKFQHQWKLIDIYRFCLLVLWCDHEVDICCSSDDDGRDFFPKIHWISLFRSWDFVQLKTPPASKFATGLVWNYATPSVSFGYIIVIVLLALQLQLIPVMHPSMFMNWTEAVISYVNNGDREQQQREINECRSTTGREVFACLNLGLLRTTCSYCTHIILERPESHLTPQSTSGSGSPIFPAV